MERYKTNLDPIDWDIKELNKEERLKIKKRLVVGITHSEKEYQAVISYLHMKYCDLMDKNPYGMNLQWLYSPVKNKAIAFDPFSGKEFDMYAFVYYDLERDMEPIAFGGSYLKYATPVLDNDGKILDGQNIDKNGKIIIGHGYVLFVDPNYRRMGIAESQWLSESRLYRDSSIRFQKEIQNEDSLKVTQAMFDDPSKCIITSSGRLKQDGTRCQIRCLLDYTDKSLIRNFNSLPENLKNFRNQFNWTFLNRENLTIEQLIKPWSK